MAQNYFSTVTNIGRNKLAISAARGAAVTITHFAIGDGNGAEVNPTAASVALVREVWRTQVESVVIDRLNPAAVLVTAIIPTAVGGWWMREFGIFDAAGAMIAVAKPVSQYKPTAMEGQLEDIRYEFQIIIGETANVTMLVDPSVLLASRDFVEKRKVPLAQLSTIPWLPVKSMTVAAPPANPRAWDTYLIPAAATGAWAGLSQKLVEWNGSSWTAVDTENGHGISLPDGRVFERVNGAYVEKLALDAQSGKWNFAVATGSANALEATLTPLPTAVTAGFSLNIAITTTNTGRATLRLNGRPSDRVLDAEGKELSAGDLVAGEITSLVFDGTAFRTRQRSPRSNQLIGSNGWCQLPGGLIMQWGRFSGRTTVGPVNGVYESEGIQITWPVAFPNRILQAVGGCGTDVGGVGLQEQAWFIDAYRTGGVALVGARAVNETLSGSFILFGY